MKVVILAGGLGTRLAEETSLRPKPMVEIGGKPILWHVMKIYAHYGFNEFIICLGYKGYMIKEYFINYYLHNSDLTVDLKDNKVDIHYSSTESFKVTLVDTGDNTNTAGRIKKIEPDVKDERFMMTYGDGVADINIGELIQFHQLRKKLITLTGISNPSRFGNLKLDENNIVKEFLEKPDADDFINGGFFVMEPGIFEYLKGDMETIQWEKKPLLEIAEAGQVAAYKHPGFWKCMDAMRDKIEMEELWATNNAAWKIW